MRGPRTVFNQIFAAVRGALGSAKFKEITEDDEALLSLVARLGSPPKQAPHTGQFWATVAKQWKRKHRGSTPHSLRTWYFRLQSHLHPSRTPH